MTFTYRRAYRGGIKLAIFDWAGTTVDYGCCGPAAVFIEGYRRKGVNITVPQARAPMGMEKRAHIAAIAAMEAVTVQWQQVHGRPICAQDIDDLYAEFAPLLLKVLADYATLIPGVTHTMDDLRRRGIRIAGTTGYFEEAAAVIAAEAARQGYQPDSNVCATQVSAGRPAPWMIYWSMNRLDVYPPQAVVSIGDTVPDVESGLNAGVWTIGVAKSGNELGLSEQEILTLGPDELAHRVEQARARLAQAGAHFVVEGVWDVPQVIDAINVRLSQGELP
jgi:phosphonoacetaldehyde hydrolase